MKRATGQNSGKIFTPYIDILIIWDFSPYNPLLTPILVGLILLEEGKEERRIPLPEETARHPDCCRVFRRAGRKLMVAPMPGDFSRPSTCRAGFSGCIPTLCLALSPLHYVWPGCVEPSLPNEGKDKRRRRQNKIFPC